MVHNVARLVVTLSGLWLYAVCAAQKPYPRLWQYGCYNLTIYQSRITQNTTLEFNAPGPCADFCLTRLSIKETFTIGLLNKGCLCLVGLSLDGSDDNHAVGCKHHCPGNPHHFCGKDNDSFSAYIVEQNQSEKESTCIARTNDATIYEEDCQQQHIPCFGADLIVRRLETPDPNFGKVQWTNISNNNNNSFQKMFEYITYPSLFSPSMLQQVISWIRAFSIYAPYVCHPPKVENGTVTSEGHGQVGAKFNYTCNSGYDSVAKNPTLECLSNGSLSGPNPPYCVEHKDANTTSIQNSTEHVTGSSTETGVTSVRNTQSTIEQSTSPDTGDGVTSVRNTQSTIEQSTSPDTGDGESDLKWVIPTAVAAVESIIIITMAVILIMERKNLRCCNSRVMDKTTVNGHTGQLIKVQENVEHQDLHGTKTGLPSSPEKINGHQRFHGQVDSDKIVQGRVDGDIPAQGHVDGDKPAQGHVDSDKHVQQQPPIGSEASKQAQTGSASRQLPPIESAHQHPPTGSVAGQSLVANGFSKIKPETFGEERASISKAPGSLNDDFNQDIDQHNDKQSRKSKKHPDETREERQRRKDRRRLKKERKRQEEESKQSKENENEHIIE